MGTWGMKSFENDSASDWISDLEEEGSVEFLAESMNLEREDGYLDSDEAVAAIAAAEVVAALLGRPAVDLPESIVKWVATNQGLDVSALQEPAVASLKEIVGPDSELNELWRENQEEYPSWVAEMNGLRDRLSK